MAEDDPNLPISGKLALEESATTPQSLLTGFRGTIWCEREVGRGLLGARWFPSFNRRLGCIRTGGNQGQTWHGRWAGGKAGCWAAGGFSGWGIGSRRQTRGWRGR